MADVDWSRIAVFADFEPHEMELVTPHFSTLCCKAGEVLIEEGTVGSSMYIMVSGKVRVSKAMLLKGMTLPLTEMQSPRKVLATLNGADYPLFGEIALIDEDIRSATVTVIEDACFLSIDRDTFFSIIEQHPVIGVRLLRTLGQRLAATVRKGNAELIKLTTALALSLNQGR